MERSVRDAYLVRLGLDAEPPSVDALHRLHRAHVERVPYESLWIHLGEPWDIDPRSSAARIATSSRGGYCFHLNGAFSELLRELGYHVTRHVGGVHGPAGATDAEMTNHLVLLVHELPTEDNQRGSWYLDAGLGDALHDPLPLLPGSYEQGPFHLVLEARTDAVGDWHLAHDPAGGFVGMAWRYAAAEMHAFADRHQWLSTSPDSGFVKVLTVQRRDATGVDVLQGLRLRRIGVGESEAIVTSATELSEVLRDVFGLDQDGVGTAAIEALWPRVHAAHVAWDAARPALMRGPGPLTARRSAQPGRAAYRIIVTDVSRAFPTGWKPTDS